MATLLCEDVRDCEFGFWFISEGEVSLFSGTSGRCFAAGQGAPKLGLVMLFLEVAGMCIAGHGGLLFGAGSFESLFRWRLG
jgi:hypothetical protein